MNLKIFIVDDDAVVLFLHRTLLKKQMPSLEISSFNESSEALNAVIEHEAEENSPPLLILLDINMPIMNGWEFLEELRRRLKPTTVSVVIVTSSINEIDKRRATQYPEVISFLEKPLTFRNIAELLVQFRAS